MALLKTAVDPHAEPRPAVDGVKDPRSHPQRLHDALLEVLAIAVRSGQLSRTGGVQTTVLVTMTADQYASGKGSAQTASGALVPTSEALAWGAGGNQQLMAVVLDQINGITAYSTLQRLYTPLQRLAIAARDKGCTFPDCDAPISWTQIHHLTDYAESRRTSVDDGAMLCDHDHRERIEEGWTALMINGRVHWKPPPWHPDQTPRRNTRHD